MLQAVAEAAALGFGSVGITGGEVFMLPSFPTTLVDIAPTVQNGVTATDLRVGDEVLPLVQALGAFLDHPGTQARGAGVVRNVR